MFWNEKFPEWPTVNSPLATVLTLIPGLFVPFVREVGR